MFFTYNDEILIHNCSGKRVCPQGTFFSDIKGCVPCNTVGESSVSLAVFTVKTAPSRRIKCPTSYVKTELHRRRIMRLKRAIRSQNPFQETDN